MRRTICQSICLAMILAQTACVGVENVKNPSLSELRSRVGNHLLLGLSPEGGPGSAAYIENECQLEDIFILPSSTDHNGVDAVLQLTFLGSFTGVKVEILSAFSGAVVYTGHATYWSFRRFCNDLRRIVTQEFKPGAEPYARVLAEKRQQRDPNSLPACDDRDKFAARQQDEESAFQHALQKIESGDVPSKLPEAVHKASVQAIYAVRQTRFSDAVDRYAEGLKVAPWWSKGHFNQALVLEKLGCFPEAIRAMKRYLLLVPAAPDAQQVQDKIYAWESIPQ
ncbi:MAG: tetratricopeptide repeat protein [Elusimicrobia bacterium]|nr:tetratricopeptide repeat protein [Elusimicrobiota bacterium]